MSEVPIEAMRGPFQGNSIVGEVTEGLHAFLKDGWPSGSRPPRIEEDLSFVPKDREEVIYIYMYRLAQNQALLTSKRWRHTRFDIVDDKGEEKHYFERPPLYLDLYYFVSVHAKFRSEAERLLGWTMMRLHEATHLVYRPRRYILPNLQEVDSLGRPWTGESDDADGLIMEKVSPALVDDLTVGDAINFFTIHDAPYRPYVTYRARCAMEGALVLGAPTLVRSQRANSIEPERPPGYRPGGRAGRDRLPRSTTNTPIGPPGQDHGPLSGPNDSEG